MRKILITTDFTPEAARNIATVLELLQHTPEQVSVLLLNTYLIPRSEPARVIELNDQLKKRSRDGLVEAKKIAEALNSNPRVTIETASHLGSLFNVAQNLLGPEKFETVSFCESGPEAIANLINTRSSSLLITCS